jgi:NitT/TauT family transport system substrate-binding protein
MFVVSTLACCPAVAKDRIMFQMGWSPSGERAQYYVAKEAGYFAAEDLEVQILAGKGAFDTLTKVATGVADLGEVGLNSLLQARITVDVPVVAVMAMYTKPLDALITTEGSNINSMADVGGKKVATSPFTASNAYWPFVLKRVGVDPASVTLIKADEAALVPLLAAGRVDAIVRYYSGLPIVNDVLSSVGKVGKAIAWADSGFEGYGNAIVTSRRFLTERRDVVVRFVRALKKGEELMKSDPARAALAMKASVPEIDSAIMEKSIRSSLPAFFNEITTRDGLGVLSPSLVKTTWEWVAQEEGVSLEKIDPLRMIDFTVAQ